MLDYGAKQRNLILSLGISLKDLLTIKKDCEKRSKNNMKSIPRKFKRENTRAYLKHKKKSQADNKKSYPVSIIK